MPWRFMECSTAAAACMVSFNCQLLLKSCAVLAMYIDRPKHPEQNRLNVVKTLHLAHAHMTPSSTQCHLVTF